MSASPSRTTACFLVLVLLFAGLALPVTADHFARGVPSPQDDGEVLFLRPNGTAYNTEVPAPPADPYAEVHGIGTSVLIQVTDADLVESTRNVQVVATRDSSGETIPLTRVAQGVYHGYVGFESSRAADNGKVHVQDGDVVSVIYVDDEDQGGETTVRQDFITWRAGFKGTVALNSASYFGDGAAVDVTVEDADIRGATFTTRVTSESDPTGFPLVLGEVATGQYQGTFAFAPGGTSDGTVAPPVLAIEDDGRFTVTYEEPGSDARGREESPTVTGTWHSSHTGIVQWTTQDRREAMPDMPDPVLYGEGSPTGASDANGWIRVEDRDMVGAKTLGVNVRSFGSPSDEVDPSGINLELKETGNHTGEFVGQLGFISGAPSTGDRLRVVHDATVEVVYTDPRDADGNNTDISANATWKHRELRFTTASSATAPAATSFDGGWVATGCTSDNGDSGCRPGRGHLRFEAPGETGPLTARLVSTRDPAGVDVTLTETSTGVFVGSFAFHHPGSHPEGTGPVDHLDVNHPEGGVAGIWAVKGDKLEAYVVGDRSTTGGLHLFKAPSVEVKDQSGATTVTVPSPASDLKLVFAKDDSTDVARERDFFGTVDQDVYLKDTNANKASGAKDEATVHLSSLDSLGTWTFDQHDVVLAGYDPNDAVDRGLTAVQYIDANGNGSHDPGEKVFLSKPAAGIQAGDIVVHPAADFGRVVTAGHADAGAAAASLSLSFAYADLNSNGGADKDDMYFLAAGGMVAAGDIVLNGTDAGRKTDGSETYNDEDLTSVSPAVRAVDLNANDAAGADEDSFWDIDGDTLRSAGDLYLGGPAAGSFESDSGREYAWHDKSGNDAIGAGDTYLLAAGSKVAKGDIIVGGPDHGTRIASGDTRIGKDLTTLDLSFLHDDKDGDTDVDAGEDVYLDVDLSGHRSAGDLYLRGPKALTIESATDRLQGGLEGGHEDLTIDETTSSSKVFHDTVDITGPVHGDTYCLHYLHRTAGGDPVKVQQSPCVRWYEERTADTDTVRSDAIKAIVTFRDASHQGEPFDPLQDVRGLRTLWVHVKDPDVVTDGTNDADEISVTVRSSSDNTGITVVLKERYGHHGMARDDVAWGGDGGTMDDRGFIGSFRFTRGASGDGQLQVKKNDLVTASFNDPSEPGGAVTPVARVRWQETTDATIQLDRGHYRHGGSDAIRSNQPVQITVTDLDRNANNAVQDTVAVLAGSTDADDDVIVTLTETTATSGVFKGQFRTERQLILDRNGITGSQEDLAVYDEDNIKVVYADIDRTGKRVERTAEATWFDQTATRILLNATTYASYDAKVAIELHDPDLNVRSSPDRVEVFVTSETDGHGERVTLRETGDDTDVFVGGFGFESSPGPGNQRLAVKDGDRFIVHFIDTETTGDGQGDEHGAKEAVGLWDLTANVGPTIDVTTDPAMDDSDAVTILPNGTVDFKIVLTDVDGTVVSWSVDHGDGSEPTRSSSSGGSIPSVLQHQYVAVGTYTVTINATDEDGARSTRSLSVIAATGDVDRPGDITGLQLEQAGKTKAALKWTAPENNADAKDGKAVASYVVKVSDATIADDTAFSAARTVSATAIDLVPADPAAPGQGQRATIRGLEPSTTYFIAVQARDGGGNRGGFDVVRVTTVATDTTAPIGVLSVVSSHDEGEEATENDISFSWSEATDDESSVVYRWELNARAAFTVTGNTGTPEQTTNTVYNNQPAGTYYFHIAACSETKCGATATYGPVIVAGTTDPPNVTRDQVIEALGRIQVAVARDGDDNVVTWELPSSPRAHGVLIWANNGDGWTRVADIPADDAAFSEGRFVHEDAPRDTRYIVTSYYGTTADEGYASDPGSVPGFDDLDDHAVVQPASDAWPMWLIVALAGVGLLLLILVVAVVVVARGRGHEQGDDMMDAPPAEPAAEPAVEEGAWGEEAWGGPEAEEPAAAEPEPWGEDLQEPEAPPYADEVPVEAPPEPEYAGAGAVVPGEAYEEPEPEEPDDPNMHHLTCPSCGADFTASGPKPLVTECPSCGVRGILR